MIWEIMRIKPLLLGMGSLLGMKKCLLVLLRVLVFPMCGGVVQKLVVKCFGDLGWIGLLCG